MCTRFPERIDRVLTFNMFFRCTWTGHFRPTTSQTMDTTHTLSTMISTMSQWSEGKTGCRRTRRTDTVDDDTRGRGGRGCPRESGREEEDLLFQNATCTFTAHAWRARAQPSLCLEIYNHQPTNCTTRIPGREKAGQLLLIVKNELIHAHHPCWSSVCEANIKLIYARRARSGC
jgi:hypothetical protein